MTFSVSQKQLETVKANLNNSKQLKETFNILVIISKLFYSLNYQVRSLGVLLRAKDRDMTFKDFLLRKMYHWSMKAMTSVLTGIKKKYLQKFQFERFDYTHLEMNSFCISLFHRNFA